MRPARDDPSLRAAQKFIATEANQIDTALDHFCCRRFMLDLRKFLCPQNRSRAEVLDKRNLVFSGYLREILRARRFHETAHEKIASVHFKDHSGFLAERALVILNRSFVRRADFPQSGAAGLQNLRNSKSTANLHQFAARDNHFLTFPRTEMAQYQYQRSRAIICHCRRFRTAKEREVVFHVGGTSTASAAFKIELEVVVIRADACERFDHRVAERRTSKIRVDHNARAINDGLNPGSQQPVDLFANPANYIVEAGNRITTA